MKLFTVHGEPALSDETQLADCTNAADCRLLNLIIQDEVAGRETASKGKGGAEKNQKNNGEDPGEGTSDNSGLELRHPTAAEAAS